MPLLGWIILFTAVGGIASAAFAGLFLLLPEKTGLRMLPHFVSFATGALIGAALLGLLPEAMQGVGPGGAHSIGVALIVGLGVFFIIEKLVLWRHAHSHEHEDPTGREIEAQGVTDALAHEDGVHGQRHGGGGHGEQAGRGPGEGRDPSHDHGRGRDHDDKLDPSVADARAQSVAFAGAVGGQVAVSSGLLGGPAQRGHEQGGRDGHKGLGHSGAGHRGPGHRGHDHSEPGAEAHSHGHGHGGGHGGHAHRGDQRGEVASGHNHGDHRHDHGSHGHDHGRDGAAGVLVLIGDSIHNALDGILIAAAFLTSVPLGLVTTVAVAAHEIPHRVGDFALLLHAGMSRQRAMFLNMATGLASVLGGIVAYFGLNEAQGALPYALALAAAGFLYIAVAGLIPGLHRRADPRTSLAQVLLMGLGVGVIAWAESLTG